MNIKALSFAIPAAVLLATTGCVRMHESVSSGVETVATGHAGGAYAPQNATRYDLENRSPAVLLDHDVERSVTFSGIQERVNADGRMEVAANIRNRLNRRIQVQINCVFKDEQGFSTGDETPFQTLILDENAQETVRFIAMNNQGRRYTIRVRQAR
jgi:hypothetical protein